MNEEGIRTQAIDYNAYASNSNCVEVDGCPYSTMMVCSLQVALTTRRFGHFLLYSVNVNFNCSHDHGVGRSRCASTLVSVGFVIVCLLLLRSNLGYLRVVISVVPVRWVAVMMVSFRGRGRSCD